MDTTCKGTNIKSLSVELAGILGSVCEGIELQGLRLRLAGLWVWVKG